MIQSAVVASYKVANKVFVDVTRPLIHIYHLTSWCDRLATGAAF